MRTLFGHVERQPGPYDAKSRAPPRLLIRSGQLTVPPTTRPYVVKTVAIEFFTEVCRLKGDAEGYVLCRKAFDSCEIRSQISLWVCWASPATIEQLGPARGSAKGRPPVGI